MNGLVLAHKGIHLLRKVKNYSSLVGMVDGLNYMGFTLQPPGYQYEFGGIWVDMGMKITTRLR